MSSPLSRYREFYRRNLPHWQPPGGTFFITLRLTGTLPRDVIARSATQDAAQAVGGPDGQADRPLGADRVWERFLSVEEVLDAGSSGPHWLATPAVATVVDQALRHFDAVRYDLGASCIMPNHLHLVLTPMRRRDGTWWPLASLLHSFKSYSATAANRVLERRGAFWQPERFDTAIRSQCELDRVVAYVANNPVKAGFASTWDAWPWTYVRSDWLGDWPA